MFGAKKAMTEEIKEIAPAPKRWPMKTRGGNKFYCEADGRPMEITEERDYFDKLTGKLTKTIVSARCVDYPYDAYYTHHTSENFTELPKSDKKNAEKAN